jgi:hypothetical protein
LFPSPASAQEAKPVLIAFARHFQLEMLVGQYDPASGQWLPNTAPFVPPAVKAPFSLFGAGGKMGDVELAEEFRTPADKEPWDWAAKIGSWDRSQTQVALALSGRWPDVPAGRDLPLNDSDSIAATSAYLKSKGIDISAPRLTQIISIDLNADGTDETIICANSDDRYVKAGASAVTYSLTLLRAQVNGKPETLPLRTQEANKPAHRDLDDHQRLHGRIGYFAILALPAITGDGKRQVAIINDNRSEGPEVDLYGFDGKAVTRLLSAHKLYF